MTSARGRWNGAESCCSLVREVGPLRLRQNSGRCSPSEQFDLLVTASVSRQCRSTKDRSPWRLPVGSNVPQPRSWYRSRKTDRARSRFGASSREWHLSRGPQVWVWDAAAALHLSQNEM